MIKTRVLWDMSDRSTPLTSVIVSAVHTSLSQGSFSNSQSAVRLSQKGLSCSSVSFCKDVFSYAIHSFLWSQLETNF